ncbi:Lactoylglutathione lyase [BD1-7 clade bacterium]|uniref:Lactoylglutathione lyase n=1 Tax=BD1-7 clade bacterium TaxID=2029982 RepID=A0A5S9NT93_9GAMM|nr:Lactoylglutathione lyase [BD1-7 clade bacterium]CAA0093873.1 Lactoylglutathione lyase [BD1-7 clade bacterium]
MDKKGPKMGKSNRVLQVTNIYQSIKFYSEVLGLELLNVTDDPKNRLTWAVMASAGDITHTVIGFSQLWAVLPDELALHNRHIHIMCDDMAAVSQTAKYFGGEVLSDKNGHCVVKDPDGYYVEVSEAQQIMLSQAA